MKKFCAILTHLFIFDQLVAGSRHAGYGFGAVHSYPHRGHRLNMITTEDLLLLAGPNDYLDGELYVHQNKTGYGFRSLDIGNITISTES